MGKMKKKVNLTHFRNFIKLKLRNILISFLFKKYESGAATAFIGRNQAIKKLQLTLADFR
jgi:hypothetical protein